jgi:hypothetical protein
MLTHTFESSTSEYHKSTIHSNDSNEALIIDKPKKKTKGTKKHKPGFLKKAMKEVADDSKTRRINSIADYIERNDLLKRKEVQAPKVVPHHLQEQQSSLYSGG